jgi:hypothetical protein
MSYDQELQLDGVLAQLLTWRSWRCLVNRTQRGPPPGNADNYHRNPETLFAENGFHWRKGDQRSTAAAAEQGSA